MASGRGQRIGIWIIAIVMTVGTIGSFAVIILANNNDKQDQIKATTEAESIAKQQEDAAKANAANSEGFDGYTARTFDAAAVTALKVETLVEGTGETIKATDSINSSYFGWISDGTIFDSSKKKDASDDAPITFPLSGVIRGWTQGLTGVKAGSVVRLSIPADLAYGPSGSGVIPANSPLEFIVKINKIDNSATQ
jgi:FKBP-type peptidyl-prolyl cis-trans isomerase FkpA/FKBP-type peptidyl-prolyl cis-trans isomerase FklB